MKLLRSAAVSQMAPAAVAARCWPVPVSRSRKSLPGVLARTLIRMLVSANGTCGRSWPSTRLTTTGGGPIEAASSAPTTPSRTPPRSGSSADPSSAASSMGTSGPHNSTGEDRWPSSGTSQDLAIRDKPAVARSDLTSDHGASMGANRAHKKRPGEENETPGQHGVRRQGLEPRTRGLRVRCSAN